MALDGAFLKFLKDELNNVLEDARVDKIYQPNSEEFVFLFRGKNGAHKVLFSSRANSARVNITDHILENPESPPMLCMLFRKKLSFAKLISVEQNQLERALSFNFSARNELGDLRRLSLVIEVMGKYSNVILLDENNIVIDALKRVNANMSSKRQILPGMKYLPPPKQNKLSLLNNDVSEISEKILNFEKDKLISSAVLSVIQGISPIVCKELSFNLTEKVDAKLGDLKDDLKLKDELRNLKDQIRNQISKPCTVKKDGVLVDFCFKKVSYCSSWDTKEYDSFSTLLDEFYFEKDTAERMKSKAQNLNKMLTNISSRIERKIEAQKLEILACNNKESYKIFGDLINSNLYKIKKGMTSIDLESFYSGNMESINVKLDPALSGAQNAQKYYKDYKKSKTAQKVLEEEIRRGCDEKAYIDAVIYTISGAQTERELFEIKEELVKEGYLKEKRGKKAKKTERSLPLEFQSSEGVKILVGKNNRQNDKLTLKLSSKNYIWLHVKDLPGSHVIIMEDSENVKENTIIEAAKLAAYYSKAKDSSGVAVDYTQVRNVKKPSGAKPGMVIYSANRTVYVTPEAELKNKLSKRTNNL